MGSGVSHLTQYDIEEVQFACDNKCALRARGCAGRINELWPGGVFGATRVRYFAPPRALANLAEAAAALMFRKVLRACACASLESAGSAC